VIDQTDTEHTQTLCFCASATVSCWTSGSIIFSGRFRPCVRV